MKKIMIATPMYGGVCHGTYFKSMIHLVNILSNNGHEINYSELSNESLITRARNTLTEIFLRSEYDYLLFIDADQGFDASAVAKMVEENEMLIGAAVPMKGINWDRVRQAAKEDKEDLSSFTSMYNVNISKDQKQVLRDNPGQKVEVDYIGTGLMLIHRDVFEKLKESTEKYKSDQDGTGGISYGEEIYNFWRTEIDPSSNRLLSEDYNFCKTWKDLGGKIFLAPYVKVVHAGTYWFK